MAPARPLLARPYRQYALTSVVIARSEATKQSRPEEPSAARDCFAALAMTACPYRCTLRRRSALPMTSTELALIAALAIIGLSKRPNAGWSAPAAIGIAK